MTLIHENPFRHPTHWAFSLGNYFGAIRQYISLQGHEQSFYFIADLHALTTVREPDVLRQNVKDAALDLLALGLDPKQATLFRQSDVPGNDRTDMAVDDYHTEASPRKMRRV